MRFRLRRIPAANLRPVGRAVDAVKLSVILPCHNEVESLPSLRDRLLPVLAAIAAAHDVELVLVDDGSSDGTRACAEAMLANAHPVRLRIASHPVNRGLGAALRTGFANARGDVLVTTDCDGTFDFGLIPGLLARLEPRVDIVTASPHHPLGGMTGVPPMRGFLSRSCSAMYRVLVTRTLHTYTSLFRAYRRSVIESVAFESDGFLAGTELLVRAVLCGYRVAELPVTLSARSFGSSKIRLGRTMLEHLKFMARLSLHQLSIQRLHA
jgi:dolichol-phosphate mannosyltransferase